MTETVDVPVVGSVPKKVVIGTVVGVAAYVGYAYWRAAQDNAAAEQPVDPGFENPEVLPVVPGGASGGYGIGNTGNPPATGEDAILTNQQWSQAVRDRLAGTYDDLAVVNALGRFLDKKPLSTGDQQIIQSALAVAGYPPSGSFQIITGGGNVGMVVAPGGLTASGISTSGFTLRWDSVAGASSYHAYEGDTGIGSTGSTSLQVTGRQPGTSSGPITVAAVSLGGSEGPRSNSITVRTTDAPAAPAPTPWTPPPPAPTPWTPPPAPAPQGPRYPQRRTFHTNVKGDNYTRLAQQYGTGLSGRQLYDYQFLSEAGRSAKALADLRKRGPDLIYPTGSTAIPYPR